MNVSIVQLDGAPTGTSRSVRFDDRLLTVLNQPADDRHDAAVRWRQLVDLVARAGPISGSVVVGEALDAIRSDARRVDEPLRAAAARAVAALPLPSGLLEYFAGESLAVSAPVLAAANLDHEQWQRLRYLADGETQRFIDTLHPEITAVAAERPALPLKPSLQESEPSAAAAYVPPALNDVVQRIEERRRIRDAGPPIRTAPAPAAPAAPALFRWECTPSGEIAWVEGAPRAAMIGRSIAPSREGDGDRVDGDVARAFAMRAPFRDGHLHLDAAGSVSGEWKISGVPAFDPADGRFAGYRGVALRESAEASGEEANDLIPEVLADPTSLRELVHEIKTPLNAIIGFAEIIEGQYLGPADHGYRERAREIVRQAKLLLTAIDDLDFAAKLHSAGAARRERVDVAALLHAGVEQIRATARLRGVDLDLTGIGVHLPATIQAELADRLLARFFAALVDLSEEGERLRVTAQRSGRRAVLAASRPGAIQGLAETELFGSGTDGVSSGFLLRLLRSLARIAGGELTAPQDRLALAFPAA